MTQQLKDLTKAFDGHGTLDRIINEGRGGVGDPALPLTIAAISQRVSPVLVIVPRSREAEALTSSLAAFTDDVCMFPAWEVLPGEAMSPTAGVMGVRIRGLHAIARGEAPKIIVCSLRAFLQRVVPQYSDPVLIARGADFPRDQLVRALTDAGYERNYLVEREGEFSVRGDIVDIFQPGDHHPFRVDFFGDTVDRIRTFHISSQRSSDDVDEVQIHPCRELALDAATRAAAADLAKDHLPGTAERRDFERIAEGVAFAGMESLLGAIREDIAPIATLLPESARLVVCDAKRCADRAKSFLEQAGHWGGALSEKLFSSYEDAFGERESIELSPFAGGDEFASLDLRAWDDLIGHPDRIAKELTALRADGAQIAIGAGTGAARAEEIFATDGFAEFVTDAQVGKGFVLRFDGKPALALVGEADIFGRRMVHRKAEDATPARASALLLQLTTGDYVVHESYGVGRYHGMSRRQIAGVFRDYLDISYYGADRLYLPTEQLALITKYSGGDQPRLNRLGGGEWDKTKSRARRAIEDITEELLTLYSSRIRAESKPFSPDTLWQGELESSFPFHETPDQSRAVDDVKADMERPSPMDRLICGDVGFGKTEVAVRAAFKAVQDSRQVAVLVPTTILAQQHMQTFRNRFAGFPIEVRQLSRFSSPHDIRESLEGLATGKVDVAIGTHRLLQQDVKFHDLGLLVVDEEQRFGVKHKERLKKMRSHIDVLTMTATPIPRTLEMAVTQIRDLSIIDTPPLDRRPVLTYVGEADERMVTAAINRELAREGQVFYVHNRVRSIGATAKKIAALVPGARIEVAHGQMDEIALERVMVDVWDGKVDVLVCTTIIESGLDIPAMNTLIVERADLLGLAQLYQLRGRVGRARERAYAYFLYPQSAALTSEAHERLKTISEYTELGSGFKIALRDLEIRGAGNILGARQSGHIAAIGFDLYMRMMSEAVQERKGAAKPAEINVRMDIAEDAFIDANYIERESLRMEAYRQIERVRSESDGESLRGELKDRYGKPPAETINLIVIAELRAFLAGHGVRELTVRDGLVKLQPVGLDETQAAAVERIEGASYRIDSQTLLLTAPAKRVATWLLSTLHAILGSHS